MIETHGYYQHGTGFPSVNGWAKMWGFNANLPIKAGGFFFSPPFGGDFGHGSLKLSLRATFESVRPIILVLLWKDFCEGLLRFA